ncbi:MAG: response regulator [Mariprofundaceae bacterium]|nr:response regulator [Mariprofundaceae bacterium]
MISIFRYYILPIIVVILGTLASYTLYLYEDHHEQQKFQTEFELRSEAHTAGVVAALRMFEQKTITLKDFVVSESMVGMDAIKQQKKLFNRSLRNEQAIRSILFISQDHTRYKLFNSQTPLSFLNDVDVQKNITLGLEKNIDRVSFYTSDKQQIWVVESFPIMDDIDVQGVLLITWDIGIEIEKALHALPVAGIDIYISNLIKTQKNSLYTHLSRSRQVVSNIDDSRVFSFSETSQLMQHTWEFSYRSAPIFLQKHSDDDAKTLFIGGLLVTFLLACLFMLLYNRERIIQQQVKKKTHELNQSKDRVTLLMNSLPEGLYDMDLEGRCTFINQRALDMFAYACKEDVLGKDAHQLFHHSDNDGHTIARDDCKVLGLIDAVDAVDAVDADNEVLWKSDGTCFPVTYRATSVFNEQQHIVGIVVTFLDTSEKIKLRKEAEILQKQVEHTQRLESLGVLAGGIAHDFNNLLSVILGNVEIARMDITEASNLDQTLKRVEQASHRAADLCKQMLAYAGKGPFVIQPINISEVIQDIGHLLDVSMHKSVNVNYQLTHSIPMIEGDKSQLQQVMMNLLTNANEAIDETSGGTIRIKTGIKSLNHTDIQQSYGEWEKVQAGYFVYLEVTDDGCGMTEETTKKIFDPFYTTKFTGRGLGMSAILGIVRSHHGVLTLDTIEGQGTTMTVYFPASSSLTVDASNEIPTPTHMSGTHLDTSSMLSETKPRNGEALILVVDDEKTLREMTGLMLEDLGYDVLYAANGEEALHLYEKEQQHINLILLDMTMPKMNGKTCLAKIHAICHDAPVLLMSGYSETEFQHLGDFLGKPFSLEDLKRKVFKLLNPQ